DEGDPDRHGEYRVDAVPPTVPASTPDGGGQREQDAQAERGRRYDDPLRVPRQRGAYPRGLVVDGEAGTHPQGARGQPGPAAAEVGAGDPGGELPPAEQAVGAGVDVAFGHEVPARVPYHQPRVIAGLLCDDRRREVLGARDLLAVPGEPVVLPQEVPQIPVAA